MLCRHPKLGTDVVDVRSYNSDYVAVWTSLNSKVDPKIVLGQHTALPWRQGVLRALGRRSRRARSHFLVFFSTF